MGIVVSSPTPTSPFFLTTGIIGLVSFVFTLATFLRVVWVNLMTLQEAEHEVHGYLTDIRTEILEERANLRTMRKGMKKHKRFARGENGGSYLGMELDDVSLKTMGDAVRHLSKRFKELEKPFLAEGEMGIAGANGHGNKNRRRRNSSASPDRYDHAAYSSPPERSSRRHSRNDEKDHDDNEIDDDAFWAQRTRYAAFTPGKRFIWLRKKAEAQQILEAMTRLQTRRIARQVGGMAVLMHEYGCGTLEVREMVGRIDERVGRVLGVRRVE
ncbi:hypothetical protein LTR09_009465 [Extremus antarcticus]|uniref:Uncharacterized protein n=1 Tax=Extremus antarcticus TaxID=702011 RepID=A0AAJ0DFG7_9PEZI|nr:hypothetical protein LTR09_009465 [Extremus antarcticus]